jgi:hypothetical protein
MQNRRPFSPKDDKRVEKEKYMMEQKAAIQDNKDSVASEEVKGEEEERAKKDAKRKQWIYNTIGLFVFGTLFSFAPLYLQTEIPWILIVSSVISVLCWLGVCWCVYQIYPHLRKNLNIEAVGCAVCAIILYYVSCFGMKQPPDQGAVLKIRECSFLLLLLAASIFLFFLPDTIAFYSRNKDKMKPLLAAKNIVTAMGVALVFATSLLTFLQTVFQIFRR